MTRRPLIAVLLATVAAAAFASPALAAPGDLPTLSGNSPNPVPDWFDDHSVGGDNHLSWSGAGSQPLYVNSAGQASQREPHDIEWESAVTVGGPGGLEVCGYPSGVTGWMRAYQIAPGDMAGGSCPAGRPASGQFGWFRYVWGRHPEALNRWHLMDLERSVLVPMAPGVPVVWDNHWGTCLNLLANDALNCEADLGATGLDVGVGDGTKVTSEGEVDAQTIPLTNPSDAPPSLLPESGTYQVVTLTNPYGILKESGGGIGQVRCVNINLTIPRSGMTYGEPAITIADPDPANCQVPAALDPMLTGPGGFDPMGGAESVPGCVIPAGQSHCWATPPTTGGFINAHSQATGNPAITPTVTVAQGADVPEAISATGRRLPPGGAVTAPAPVAAARTMPAPSKASSTTSAATRRATTIATTRTRSALRRVFGTGLTGLRVSCRLRPASAATCNVSWRKSGAGYSGKVFLRNARLNGRLRWQYRVDVAKRKNGRTTHVRRAYRTGGLISG
jgi:hypothetical protein